MNLFTKLLIFLCAVSASAFSIENCVLINEPFYEGICLPRIEAKAGYFIFADKKMRDIYPHGGFEVQLSGSYPIKEWLHMYGSVGFIEAIGKSKPLHQKTTFWQIPVDLGLKAIMSITPCAEWYVALGPRYFYAHQHNHSSSVDSNLSKNGFGLFVNTGIEYFFTPCWYATCFGEYAYEPIRPSSSKTGVHTRRVQIGGYTVGIGAGYRF